ncbi:ABC transporter ATP-binding protein [Leptodesmis sp.]|uniref:ABC transporter ATP-binding protein n=1 Tax=Leptodesmis sp. TaxID=3100501 RepID=UPI0040535119
MVDEPTNPLNSEIEALVNPSSIEQSDVLAEVEAVKAAQSPELPLLVASGLNKSFGGIRAIDNAAIEVRKGSITGLVGPNGAGKTTLFNLLLNFIRSDSGRVLFDGEPVHHLPPYRIARMGMVRTFQVARALSRMSVMDNMLLAAQKQTGENFWMTWFKQREIAQEEKQQRQKAMEILESIGLAHMASEYAGALSGGQRKLLEMGRALMTDPKLILLDEPAAGVNPTLINQICDRIQRWNREGLTFLIIEHNMDVIMSLCDRVWVLAEGRNLAAGTPAEIQSNPEVLEAYLGQ